MYLRYGYVPSPASIYESSFKLPAGSKMHFNLNKLILKKIKQINDFKDYSNIDISAWWELPSIEKKRLSKEDAKDRLRETLLNSTKMQQISDVPIGTFLSGGIDSSLITSLISKNSNDIKCFNIGFEFSSFDESKFRAYIQSKNDQVTVEVVNDSIDQAKFVALEWTGLYFDVARKYS